MTANKQTTICFTGHRPGKIHAAGVWVARQLDAAIERAAKAGYITFISGGALGTDQVAARIVIDLQYRYNIALILAEPFDCFWSKWAAPDVRNYEGLKRFASRVEIVTPGGYEPWKYQKRNEWMVDRSSAAIAVWDGSDGGTKNTVDYARKMGLPVFRIDPKGRVAGWM